MAESTGTTRGELSETARQRLAMVSTATLTTQLMHLGLTNCFMAGVAPLRPDLHLVGTAFTLRYVPVRGEFQQGMHYDNRTNVQRLAVERIGPGEVLVIDARGELGSGTLGEILATRMLRRGATGIVTDGGVRDSAGIRALDIPSYCGGVHAAASARRHLPVDQQVPIACGGVLVMPGDAIVGDQDGVVAFPVELAEEVAAAALEQDRLEDWVRRRVDAGSSIVDTYPPDERTRAEYEEWRRQPGNAP
ncbi:MAG: ribonuclease activity regulator RraA [Candidatus Dormibacteraceae bacterium]